ncbi:Transposase, Mutator family [Planctomycetes bacterium Poly30]|uniref:Mutator family transposase n=2 Tax=Saltatorellus ferox TaxID=2528018 RepID=A0A518EYT5_9BACT|nr:Transposase, Mutator family [Planctomycetes bacterium Poly30]QDV09252.1 Transposase, Mutator family [Planctomycetes bacterium Poly30]QDV09281.1 Transposase, Mutator family [Planctomycetes bacterium Poly30]QDV09325.1 Transposase, Mutator family [Planctomycetes bacterium Poly30]
MPHHEADANKISLVLELLTEHGFDRLAEAIQILLNEAMLIERSDYLNAAPYERAESRRGYANGFKPKRVASRVGELELRIPQVREAAEGGERFYPNALERGERGERALKLAIAEMYINGVSTRRVQRVTEELCGLKITSSQVSRATQLLDEEISSWRSRPIGACPYLVLDARYEKVRIGGSVVTAAVLVAMAVREDGKRSIVGVSVATSEAEVHWREFLQSLVLRGLHGVRLFTSDDHPGIKAALASVFPGVAWQRCQCHMQRNAQSYVSKIVMKKDVAEDLRSIFNAPTMADAEQIIKTVVVKYQDSEPRVAAWIEENIHEGLAVLQSPASHRRRLRTSNAVERLNKEIKRRTRVAGLFPNEAALLRLVTALAMEVSEDWEAGRQYLTMEQA